MCVCGHEISSHHQAEDFCLWVGCGCTFYSDGRLVVEPGHDRFGTEYGYAHIQVAHPVDPDADLIFALRDEYVAYAKLGLHPENTIGGA